MSEVIDLKRTQHGPFERLMLTAPDVFKPAAQSVYRIGDTLIDTGGTRVADALVEALRHDPPRRCRRIASRVWSHPGVHRAQLRAAVADV